MQGLLLCNNNNNNKMKERPGSSARGGKLAKLKRGKLRDLFERWNNSQVYINEYPAADEVF